MYSFMAPRFLMRPPQYTNQRQAMRFRGLTAADIIALHDLEAECFLSSLYESDAAFLQLIELYAVGAFDQDDLCGYAIGVPLNAGMTLELRAPLAAIPEAPDTLYVHDVAVAARCRGTRLGRALATRLLDVARAGLYGAETLSRRQFVLVDEAAETIAAQNPSITACRHRRRRPSWLRWRER
jgi:ribosomal protein S18 acetylase RimI-like enzyme